jgi:SAM-dependent methyltransferase
MDRARNLLDRSGVCMKKAGENMSAQRDAVLLKDAREVIVQQPALSTADLSLDVCGGVVHVGGHIAGSGALRRLRHVLARLRGVHAVWDMVQVEGEPPMRVLDVGCGARKQYAGAIGIDRHAHADVDIVADLERGLPVGDQSIDHVFAVHFLEHVHNLLPLLNELHRVLRPEGVLHVMVPHRASINAWADPTHVRFFDPQTFKFLCRPYPDLRPYFPLIVSETAADIFADLQPVGNGRALAGEEDLARYFN